MALTDGAVQTLVGKDLFVFGNADGDAQHARLQHPLAIAYAHGAVWVGDTYNDTLRRIDPRTGETHTVAGGPDHALFYEPAAMTAEGDRLIVADTNHHRLVSLAIPAHGAEPTTRPWVPEALTAPRLTTHVAVAATDGTPERHVPSNRISAP